MTKVLTLLLHDERFSGWTPRDKLVRQHFSTQYLRFYRHKGADPMLYTFHEHVKSNQIHELDRVGTVKIFPVRFRFPPFLRFGNDHNPESIMREMLRDQPDLVHFHHYYLFSYPYTAMFVKKRLRRPLIVQLHGVNDNYFRKWCYLPCLLALKHADRILYSYEPEKLIYEKLGIADKVVKLPFPGVDPEVFRPQKRRSSNRLLYVGRIPDRETAYGEKSPFLLIRIFERLLHHDENVLLDIVGDGPGLSRSRRLAQSLKVADRVSFHGYVDHKDLPAYYRASALTFSPIQLYDIDGWIDGAIQESLACGTPVVALKASAKARLRGTYGFLLSNNTERAAEELHELLKAPEEMNQVAREGSRFVRENCSCDKVVSELDRTLEDVIRN